MKLRRTLTCLLACAMSASLFTACGGDKGDDTPSVDPDDITVNLDTNITADLEIMVPGGNINERTMINCLIDSFGEIFPNVSINMSYVSVDNYVSAVQQQQLAGTLPDIIWSNSPDFYDLVESKTFEDLTPYIQASQNAETVNTYLNAEGVASKFDYENDFYTEYFDMGSANGKKYVVPRSCDTVVTFINKEILTKAGVDLNPETTKVKNGWTWNDFLDVCATVRSWMDNNKMSSNYVFDANLTSWLSVCYPMLLSYGGEVLTESGEIAIDSQATRNCLEMVSYLVENRYINDSTVTTTGSYDNGMSAMLFQSASVSLYADRKALKYLDGTTKVDLVSFPLITDNNAPKIGAGIAGYAINAKSSQKELAWAFLQHLLSYSGQQEMALNGLNLASIRKDLSDHTTANWGKGYETLNLSAYTYGSEYKISTDFFTRTTLTAKLGLDQALRQMFLNASNAEKAKDIDDIITKTVRDMEYAMIEY